MPAGRYGDFYEQLTSYIAIVTHEAQAIDPAAIAATFAPVETHEDESVFRYHDSASSRAGIKLANAKLELPRVAIVGLGGTGSYSSICSPRPGRRDSPLRRRPPAQPQRVPGPGSGRARRPRAAPAEGRPTSRGSTIVFTATSSRTARAGRRTTPTELDEMGFVFFAMDSGPAKHAIVEHLENRGVAFIDVGMGLDELDGSIGGILRVTTQHPGHARPRLGKPPDRVRRPRRRGERVRAQHPGRRSQRAQRLPGDDPLQEVFGFYRDLEHEHNSLYTIDGNHLLNEDQL